MTGWRLCGLTIVLGGFLAVNGQVHEGVALPDFDVQTSSGVISFHGVSVNKSLRIDGLVTNRTDRRWTAVLFEFELLSADGKIVGRAPLLYKNLLPAQSKELADRPVQLLDPNRRDFSGYRILYRTGELEVSYVLTLLKPQPSRLLQYEDETTEFSFSILDTCINLKLKNKSSSPITVDWSGARFVDIFEQSHSVTHVGNSKVGPFERLSETIEPALTAAVEPGQYEGWRTGRVLPRTLDAGELKGKTISLSLPLESGGVRTIYQFVFQVAETLF
jgi:hypothetical protein